MKKFFFVLMASLLFCTTPAMAADWQLVEEVYIVQEDDTVESIAAEYIGKNTYGPREEREFAEGIRELNDMMPGEEVSPGQVIRINYWIEKGE
jgi:predicted Zn-dependent protease